MTSHGSHPRLLHLIDPPGCGWPALAGLRAVLEHAQSASDHDVLFVGGSFLDQHARWLGLDTVDRLCPPLETAEFAGRSLARWIDAHGEPRCVVAWSQATLQLARIGAPGIRRCAVLHIAPREERPRVTRLLTMRSSFGGRRAVHEDLLVATDGLARRWGGWRERRDAAVTTIGVPPRRISDQSGRSELRACWGVDDATKVIVALGEPAEHLDARMANYITGLIAVGGERVALVVPSRAAEVERALRFTQRHHGLWRTVIDDGPHDAVLAAADAVLWLPEAAVAHRALGIVGLGWAAEMGLPGIALGRSESREVLSDAQGIVVAPNLKPQNLLAAWRSSQAMGHRPNRIPGAGSDAALAWARGIEQRCFEQAPAGAMLAASAPRRS